MNRRQFTAWVVVFSSVLLSVMTSAGVRAGDEKPLVFGVFPYLSIDQLERLYAPVAADLSAAVNRPVQLRTRPTFDLFRNEVIQQRYDLLFIQPFAYASVASQNGYLSIARPSAQLKAVFVVREDSAVEDFSQLKGKTLSAPPQRAAVSLLGKETLRRHDLIPGHQIRITYQNSHPACLRAVLIRKSEACITAPAPLQIFQTQTDVHFKILGYSDPIPGSTYAVHQRLPENLRATIARRIVSWHQTDKGKALLKSIKFPGFVNSDDNDYKPVRDTLQSLRNTDKDIVGD